MFGTLKSRLYILVCIIALPGVLTIFYQAVQERGEAIQAHTDQAIEIAQRLSYAQQKILYDTQAYLKHLATVPEIQQPSSPVCGEFLRSVLRLNSTYVNIGVPRADGELLCNALPLKTKVNVFDREYFQYSLTQHEFSIGTYQFDRAAQRTSVNFAYPVFNEGQKPVGVVVAVVSLDWWSQQLSDYNLPKGAVAFITDEKAKVVANFPVEVLLHGQGPEHYNVSIEPSKDYLLETETVLGSDQVSRIFTHQILYRKPNGKKVTVSVGIPIDSALKDENTQFIVTIFSFLIFLSMVTFLAIKILRISILNPLQQLTDATAKLERGIPADELNAQGAAELRVLGQHFKQMATARLDAEISARKRSSELDSVFNALPDLYFRIDRQDIIVDYRASTPDDLYVSQIGRAHV